MITKECQCSGWDDERGPAFHILRPGYDDCIDKVKLAQASPAVLDQVRSIMRTLGPKNGKLFALVSALGASEYYGPNSNGDDFPESALLHTPEGWSTMSHRMQRMAGKGWEWGYPTFYNANFFQHHKNGDPNKAFGSVEYVVWDPEMKRVLLIVALDRSRAETEGAVSVIDRIEHGEYPSVSMGAKVPYDLCSVCTEWDRITGNPKRDLAEHKRRPIQGLSVTTRDYCSHIRFECGKVYPSGLQVKMVNLHPRFFDISAVFIGADKTSYVLAKLAGYCPVKPGARACPKGCRDCSLPSSAVREVAALEKVAAANFAKHSPKGKVIPFSKGKMTKRSQFDDYIDPQTEESVASYFQRKVQRGF